MLIEDLTARVGDVLDNPAKFEGQMLADPIEGTEYGRGKAKIIVGGDGLPFINSFAHGSAVYRLRYDARAIRERVDAAADKIGTLAKLMLAADLDAVEEERLVKEIAKAERVSIRAIRSKVNEAKVERDTRAGDNARAAVERLNCDYALVIVGGKTSVMEFEEGGKAFRLLQVNSFRQWYANLPPVTVGGRLVPVADYWMSHAERHQYRGIEFVPTALNAPDRGRGGYYNLWRGFAVEPREGDCSKLLDHIRDNVAGGDTVLYNWIVGWFADIAQNPDKKPGTALVLRGSMGVGKTIVGRMFGSVLGDHYALVADSRYVTGQFNSHMASLLLLQADEAFWAGDKRAEGKLRDLITGEDHFIEFKFHEPIRIANNLRLFVTGNEDWVVPAGFEERRFAVVDVNGARRQDTAYFEAIAEQMNNSGREALLYHLLNFDLSRVNLRSVPRTAALFDQQVHSADSRQAWWLETLERGQLPLSNAEQNACDRDRLFNSYVRHANLRGVRVKSLQSMLGKFLKKYVGPDLQSKRVQYTEQVDRVRVEKREWVYVFPPLKQCRERMAAMMQQEIAWENPEQEWEELEREQPM
jgi:hypothetical protein